MTVREMIASIVRVTMVVKGRVIMTVMVTSESDVGGDGVRWQQRC